MPLSYLWLTNLKTLYLDNIAQNTGQLFGKLFTAFDQENFLKLVSLFERRFKENNLDLYFFGKKCLDLCCGGERYSIALSKLGAAQVTGVDVSKTAIEDATIRAASLETRISNFYIMTA